MADVLPDRLLVLPSERGGPPVVQRAHGIPVIEPRGESSGLYASFVTPSGPPCTESTVGYGPSVPGTPTHAWIEVPSEEGNETDRNARATGYPVVADDRTHALRPDR